MDKVTIGRKIDLVLNNVYVEDSENYIFARNKQRYMNRSQDMDFEIESYPEDIDFINKQVLLLKKLFTNLSIQEKALFKEILIEKLSTSPSVIGTTIFNTLIHTGSFDESYKLILLNYSSYSNTLALEQLKLLTYILKNEWNIFSTKQIEGIYDWANDALDAKNDIGQDNRNYPNLYKNHVPVWAKLFRQSNAILVKDLGSHLENGVDFEISIDKELLTKEFKRFGFAEDLEETLEKIDKKLSLAEDNFDYKNSMDLLRSFTERLYEQIAKTLRIKNLHGGEERDSEKVAKLFKEYGLISDGIAKMLISLRHFLSNEGSHRLKSKKEDARLSRNMTIEFSLYLVRLLEIKIADRK